MVNAKDFKITDQDYPYGEKLTYICGRAEEKARRDKLADERTARKRWANFVKKTEDKIWNLIENLVNFTGL